MRLSPPGFVFETCIYPLRFLSCSFRIKRASSLYSVQNLEPSIFFPFSGLRRIRLASFVRSARWIVEYHAIPSRLRNMSSCLSDSSALAAFDLSVESPFGFLYNEHVARVVKLVDAVDSKSIDSDVVPVRVRPWAPFSNFSPQIWGFFYETK